MQFSQCSGRLLDCLRASRCQRVAAVLNVMCDHAAGLLMSGSSKQATVVSNTRDIPDICRRPMYGVLKFAVVDERCTFAENVCLGQLPQKERNSEQRGLTFTVLIATFFYFTSSPSARIPLQCVLEAFPTMARVLALHTRTPTHAIMLPVH